MRHPLIAANWKMHPIPEGALEKDSPYRSRAGVDVVVFATYLDLRLCIEAQLFTGAQAGHAETHGAHTGDISMTMLKDLGCHSVLCGHSERRKDHGETNEQVTAQAIAALEAGLHPIICVGETIKERDAGKAEAVVEQQLAGLPLESDVTIAYEPVWAIGTGRTATPEEAQSMHAFIRSKLPENTRENIRILYGGSVKPINATAMFEQPDVDGALVGGASLKPEEFREIVESV